MILALVVGKVGYAGIQEPLFIHRQKVDSSIFILYYVNGKIEF